MPFTLEPYKNPYATTLASLVGAGDRARADALMASAGATARGQEQAGQAWAQGISNVGQQTGATLNNLAQLKIHQDSPEYQHAQIQVRAAKQAEQDDVAARQAFKDAQGDPERAITLLEGKGNYPVAMKLRSQLVEQRVKALDITAKQLDTNEKRLTQASQLLQGVPTSADPAAAYASVLPQVRGIVGEDLGKRLPDQYDEAIVKQALTWGMKAGDVMRMRRDAAQTALSGVRDAVTKTELVGKLRDALAKSAATVESQEEWASARTLVQKLGGDTATDVLAQFPETFSPELATKANAILQAGQKPANYQHETVTYTGPDGKRHIGEAGFDPNTNQWFAPGSSTALTNVRKFEKDPSTAGQADVAGLSKAVLDNPDVYNDLTDSAKTAIWPTLSAAGFKPPAKVDRGQSVATAERWRLNQLADLDKTYKAAQALPDVNGTMTPEEYAQKKAEIERSYQVQIGKPGGAPAAAAPKPPAPAAPKKRATLEQATSMLKDQAPGHKYTLTDGTVWIKAADGTISQGN